jgi:hypothetical protein
LEKNASLCGHCGKQFIRMGPPTPLISRADANFHLNLFAGPVSRRVFVRGLPQKQAVCHFSYRHDQLGRKDYTVSVVIRDPAEQPDIVLEQIENAADEIAVLLRAGSKLMAIYTLTDRILAPAIAFRVPTV